MRLQRLLPLAAVVLLALAAVACSQQAEATDADVAGEAPSESYIMDYSAFNDTTLVDEIRGLDEGVYLGVGTTAAEDGGRSAPGHFALVGPTDEWVGAEE